MSFFKKNKPFLNNLFKKDNFEMALSQKVKELFYADFEAFIINKIKNKINNKNKKPKNKKVDDLEDMKKEYEKIYIMKI